MAVWSRRSSTKGPRGGDFPYAGVPTSASHHHYTWFGICARTSRCHSEAEPLYEVEYHGRGSTSLKPIDLVNLDIDEVEIGLLRVCLC